MNWGNIVLLAVSFTVVAVVAFFAGIAWLALRSRRVLAGLAEATTEDADEEVEAEQVIKSYQIPAELIQRIIEIRATRIKTEEEIVRLETMIDGIKSSVTQWWRDVESYLGVKDKGLHLQWNAEKNVVEEYGRIENKRV